MAPLVSFVIPVRNDAHRLRHCINTIRANSYLQELIEVIVIDNGSTDRTPDVAGETKSVLLSMPGERLGAMRNAGAAKARGSIIAFVDADHEIAPGWVHAAVENLADPSVGAAGADCFPPARANWVQRTYDLQRRHPEGTHPTEWLGSGNMAVRRDAFEATGGFDTTLETCEDVDLCRKLRLAGKTLVQDSRMHNVHFGDPVTLKQVFRGELWRGRDNLRVSLRSPRTFRTLVSALIPVANLIALFLIPVALLLPSSAITRFLLVAALLTLVGSVLLRITRMTVGRKIAVVPGAMAVSAVYELARALALPSRVSYGARRTQR